MSNHRQGCQTEEKSERDADGCCAGLPVVVELVLKGRAVAVRDVERGHDGADADQDNLTPEIKKKVIFEFKILSNLR